MSVFSSALLSGGSANGTPIQVAATASPGTTIHTVGTGSVDEIYLWAANISTSPVALTIEFGGTGDANSACKTVVIPANSPPIPIIPGIRLNSTLVVKAFAGTTNVINITGHVNRIT